MRKFNIGDVVYATSNQYIHTSSRFFYVGLVVGHSSDHEPKVMHLYYTKEHCFMNKYMNTHKDEKDRIQLRKHIQSIVRPDTTNSGRAAIARYKAISSFSSDFLIRNFTVHARDFELFDGNQIEKMFDIMYQLKMKNDTSVNHHTYGSDIRSIKEEFITQLHFFFRNIYPPMLDYLPTIPTIDC